MIVSPQDDTDSLRPDADVDDVVFFSFAVQWVHGSREPASPAFQVVSTGRRRQANARGGKLCCALQWKLTRSPPGFKIRWAGLRLSLPGFLIG